MRPEGLPVVSFYKTPFTTGCKHCLAPVSFSTDTSPNTLVYSCMEVKGEAGRPSLLKRLHRGLLAQP